MRRAAYAINVIRVSLDAFKAVLFHHKDRRSALRSLLAHSRSTGECLTNVFTVHPCNEEKVLCIDFELERNGVHTSLIPSKTVSFVVLNLVTLRATRTPS